MKFFILCCFPLAIFSQSIRGKVYDHESTVKGIKVYNISQKIKTYTDNEGDFTIAASVNDTLFFESLFHQPKYVKLKDIDFNDITVFELKKVINALGEVLLIDEKVKEFAPVEYTDAVGLQLANDIKNNPHLYMPQSSYSNGANIFALIGMALKLFKKKNKPKPVEYIKYQHLDSLFKKDKLFNLKLLNQDLNISEDYANLFLDYCESKNLNKDLMSKEHQVVLLDSMVRFSEEFLKLTKEFETSKDSLGLKN